MKASRKKTLRKKTLKKKTSRKTLRKKQMKGGWNWKKIDKSSGKWALTPYEGAQIKEIKKWYDNEVLNIKGKVYKGISGDTRYYMDNPDKYLKVLVDPSFSYRHDARNLRDDIARVNKVADTFESKVREEALQKFITFLKNDDTQKQPLLWELVDKNIASVIKDANKNATLIERMNNLSKTIKELRKDIDIENLVTPKDAELARNILVQYLFPNSTGKDRFVPDYESFHVGLPDTKPYSSPPVPAPAPAPEPVPNPSS